MPDYLMSNGWSYMFYLTLICRKLGVQLEIPKFNNVYMLKQTPTNTRRIYMLDKQDYGINVIFLGNENNLNFFSMFMVDGK